MSGSTRRAAVVAFLVASVAAGCAGDQADESLTPSVTPPSALPTADDPLVAPSAAPTAAPASTSEPTAFEITWTEQAFDELINDVVVDGDRIVAVGQSPDGRFHAWTSADGAGWQQHDVPPPVVLIDESSDLPEETAASGSAMGTLVRLDETLFSFGAFNFMDHVRPVGWRWTDGEDWAFVDSDSEFYRSGRVLDAMATEGALVVARAEPALAWQGADSTIWRWTPDSSWVEADVSRSESAHVFVTQLARSDDAFLATGLIPIDDPDDPEAARPAAWRSSDGQVWETFGPPPGADHLCALEADPLGGFLGIGFGANGLGAWRLSDGEWQEHLLAGPIERPEGDPVFSNACWLLRAAGGWVALVLTDDGIHAWTSEDGSTWLDAGIIAPRAYLAVADEDRIILVSMAEDPSTGLMTSTVRVGSTAP